MSRWPNSAPLSEGPGGAGVSTPAYSGLRMHDALGFTIDPCGKRKQPVGKVTAPGPTWPLREIRKAIICRLSQELGSAIFRVTLEEAEMRGHWSALLPGQMLIGVRTGPLAERLFSCRSERRPVPDRTRGNKKGGPREAPADRVERSTCPSTGSRTTVKHGATSGPALAAGDERREIHGAQCGDSLLTI